MSGDVHQRSLVLISFDRSAFCIPICALNCNMRNFRIPLAGSSEVVILMEPDSVPLKKKKKL
ncbi:hypothetical protein RchiOBHm_Chr2g0101361 [Rosa chinensis]|uniref:Uncharacterized protein n=1 Tax=Rosa chinensis TaxID=74649 RepID=A0A2P6RMC9_ROSCH|nr:hypothetical protein RchiOBHm_Chr2g0101361 [Rosa chinensis]